MSNHFQEVCETHNITTEQGDIIMRMGHMTAFMNGWFGEKETEIRQMGLLKDVKIRKSSAVKLTTAGKEIAAQLSMASTKDIIASN